MSDEPDWKARLRALLKEQELTYRDLAERASLAGSHAIAGDRGRTSGPSRPRGSTRRTGRGRTHAALRFRLPRGAGHEEPQEQRKYPHFPLQK